jgi:hypothetical protein
LGIGVETRGHNVTISYCKIHEILNHGFVGLGDSTIVEYSEFYNCSLLNENGGLPAPSSWGAAVMITGTSSTAISWPIVRHNLIYNIWGEGPTVRYTKYALFEDNTIYNCFSVALYVQNSRYAKVQRNIIYSTGHMRNDEARDNAEVGIGLWDESYSEPTVSRVTVINNLVYGCDRNLVNYAGDTIAIIGNTFVNSMSTTHNVQLGTGGLTFTKGYFANNIIDENDGTAPTNLIGVYGTGTANVTFKNNSYSRALSGEYELPASDAGDVIGDPVLEKAGSTEAGLLSLLYFELDALSPAIDQGLNMESLLGIYYDTTGVNQDYEQSTRDETPDIGAWEAAGEPVTPPILATVLTTVPSAWVRGGIGGGTVSSDGGGTVSARGVCWSTSANPTISDSKTSDGTGTGVFNSIITGLVRNTTYHIRAYATNEEGTAYGIDVEFTTPKVSPAKVGGVVSFSNGVLQIIR